MISNENELADQRHFDVWQELEKCSINELHAALQSIDENYRYVSAQQLHLRGSHETFELARSLLESRNSTHREIAAFTLGQLGTPDRPFLNESAPLLIGRLDADEDASVRAAAASALGHLRAEAALKTLCAALNDLDPNVRSDAAFALGRLGREEAVAHLLHLTTDHDSTVVESAMLGLRSLNFDLESVRNRFVELLKDERMEIVDEAIAALAQWRDERALSALQERLGATEVNLDLMYAACDLGDASVLPRLIELNAEWGDGAPNSLRDAISVLSNLKTATPNKP